MTSYLGKFLDVFQGMNQATLSGAIDVVVVRHEDGTMYSTPFHVRFGKLQVLRSQEKIVRVKVNGQESPHFHMKLGRAGEAFFVIESDEPVGGDWVTSPIASPATHMSSGDEQEMKKLMLDDDADEPGSGEEADGENTAAEEGAEVAAAVATPATVVVTPPAEEDEDEEPTPAMEIQVEESVAALGPLQAFSTDHSPELNPQQAPETPPTHPATRPIPENNNNNNGNGDGDNEDELAVDAHLTTPEKKWVWDWGGLPGRNMSSTSDQVRRSTLLRQRSLSARKLGSSRRSGSERASYNRSDDDSEDDQQMFSPANRNNKQPQSHKKKRGGWVRSIFGGWWYKGRVPTSQELQERKTQTHHSRSQSALPTVSRDDAMDGVMKGLQRVASVEDLQNEHRVSIALMDKQADANQVELSLCGHLLNDDIKHNTMVFREHCISYADFCSDPSLVFEPSLTFRSKDRLYPSRIALPLLLSKVAFGKPLTLTDSALESLSELTPTTYEYQQHIKKRKASVAANDPEHADDADEDVAEKVTPRGQGGWRTWFRGRRGQKNRSEAENNNNNNNNDNNRPPPIKTEGLDSLADDNRSVTSEGGHTGRESADPASGSDDEWKHNGVYYRKSLRPTEEMLASLNLQYGRNDVSFTVQSRLQGKQVVKGSIYVWKPDSRIVISDIDGTITKSDILGNLMPLVGRDWSHGGVTELFTGVKDNGYEILYLTARAIGQANVTRNYIRTLSQGDHKLPDGPMLMSPDRLVASFNREVIERTPHQFKIAALRDVRLLFALFGPDGMLPTPLPNPFHAGFGNRPSDVLSYQTVGVPVNRIFIINPSGDIGHVNKNFVKSYPELNAELDSVFPVHDAKGKSSAEYSSFKFWQQDMDAPGDFHPLSDVTKNFYGSDDEDENAYSPSLESVWQ